MALERRTARLAIVLALVGCGPSVALDGETEGTAGSESTASVPGPTASSPTPSPDATSLPATTVAPDGDDGEDGDTCLGECGVECFADDECGPGGYCRDDNTCGTLPQLQPCENAPLLGEPELLVEDIVLDVELGDLEGDGDLDVVALTGTQGQLLVLRGDGAGPPALDGAFDPPGSVQGIAIGDDDGDGLFEAFAADRLQVWRFPGDPGLIFGTPVHYTAIDGGAIATASVDGDAFADLVLGGDLFEASIHSILANGMGAPGTHASTPIRAQGGLGGRFAFAARDAGGITVAVAGAGAARRFVSRTDGTFDEGNRLQVTSTFMDTPIADVAIVAWGEDDGERLAAIANVLGQTIVSLADFQSGAALYEERFALAQPSVRVGVAWDTWFDLVLGTESGDVLGVERDLQCYAAHPLGAVVIELAIGDVTGDGAADVLAATDGGLWLLRGVG